MLRNCIKQHHLLLAYFLIGIFFRFYNINWGAPYYFHPDERQNIAYSVLSSHSLFMLDQKNFDTGTFPLIIIQLIFSGITRVFHTSDQFQLVILISRVVSACISIGILLGLFFICKKIFDIQKSCLIVMLAIFSVGFIQFSHFGTIELWEAIFFLFLFYYTWRIAQYCHIRDGVITGILLGCAISTKVLSVILIPAIILSFFLFPFHQPIAKNNIVRNVKKILLVFSFFVLFSFCSFIITSVPLLKNFHDAFASIQFESGVALGKTPVFYTQGFYRTIPILFQFTNVYPFLLNPLITLLFIPSIFSVIYLGIKNKKPSYILLTVFYVLLFVSQSFFFVKWTRYMISTLPFVYTIVGIAIDDWLHFIKNKSNSNIFFYAFITVPVVVSFIFAASFFIVTYLETPTPIAASNFAKLAIPSHANVLSEIYDPNTAPFNAYFPEIYYFDFYNLETSKNELTQLLPQIDYIIIPSQRILKTRLSNPKDFPTGNTFYTQLVNGAFGFTSIYETPCDIFCRITYLRNPIFSYEETASVFDRPTILIFKKTRSFKENVYHALLQ